MDVGRVTSKVRWCIDVGFAIGMLVLRTLYRHRRLHKGCFKEEKIEFGTAGICSSFSGQFVALLRRCGQRRSIWKVGKVDQISKAHIIDV